MSVTILFSLLILLIPSIALASGGFTWVSHIIHTFHLPVAEHVFTFGLIALFMFTIGILYRSSLAKIHNIVIPDYGLTLRNFVEAYGQFIMNQCKAVIGEKEGPKYFNFIATIFITILLCNLIGLIPGFLPPTEHLSTTMALGLFSFIYYNIKGCKEMGIVNYFKHFAGPLWYMAILIFPIEILSNCIRPISLALRLRGNMYGDHLVLSVFSGLAPLIVPIVFMVLGILVSIIQAYVFTVLSMVYISLATAHHDHAEHGESHH
jgi:F-type H+-transporting ATPase subunit a